MGQYDHHQERPIKYCLTCEFHFKAAPEDHEEAYHDNGQWMYVEGNYEDAP